MCDRVVGGPLPPIQGDKVASITEGVDLLALDTGPDDALPDDNIFVQYKLPDSYCCDSALIFTNGGFERPALHRMVKDWYGEIMQKRATKKRKTEEAIALSRTRNESLCSVDSLTQSGESQEVSDIGPELSEDNQDLVSDVAESDYDTDSSSLCQPHALSASVDMEKTNSSSVLHDSCITSSPQSFSASTPTPISVPSLKMPVSLPSSSAHNTTLGAGSLRLGNLPAENTKSLLISQSGALGVLTVPGTLNPGPRLSSLASAHLQPTTHPLNPGPNLSSLASAHLQPTIHPLNPSPNLSSLAIAHLQPTTHPLNSGPNLSSLASAHLQSSQFNSPSQASVQFGLPSLPSLPSSSSSDPVGLQASPLASLAASYLERSQSESVSSHMPSQGIFNQPPLGSLTGSPASRNIPFPPHSDLNIPKLVGSPKEKNTLDSLSSGFLSKSGGLPIPVTNSVTDQQVLEISSLSSLSNVRCNTSQNILIPPVFSFQQALSKNSPSQHSSGSFPVINTSAEFPQDRPSVPPGFSPLTGLAPSPPGFPLTRPSVPPEFTSQTGLTQGFPTLFASTIHAGVTDPPLLPSSVSPSNISSSALQHPETFTAVGTLPLDTQDYDSDEVEMGEVDGDIDLLAALKKPIDDTAHQTEEKMEKVEENLMTIEDSHFVPDISLLKQMPSPFGRVMMKMPAALTVTRSMEKIIHVPFHIFKFDSPSPDERVREALQDQQNPAWYRLISRERQNRR